MIVTLDSLYLVEARPDIKAKQRSYEYANSEKRAGWWWRRALSDLPLASASLQSNTLPGGEIDCRKIATLPVTLFDS